MSNNAIKRCAIYTRKSSEEGLERDYNSLHAQREACEAFIRSQTGEGWRLVSTAYDDGGFSGGTMERPALQQLLADIRKGLIDVVVVYKVDRLTRALTDFAKMVELFDQQRVSFVAVGSAGIAGQTQTGMSFRPGGEALASAPQSSLSQIAAPAPTPEAAPIPVWAALNQAQQDYPCAIIEAAKTEAFLGIDSASTMSAAIRGSESDNPNDRIVAAVIFSYLGTQEAEQDLKTLGNDADSRVAGISKEAASFGEDPGPSSRTIVRQVNPPGIPTASFMR